MYRPEPFFKLCFCETGKQKLRLAEHSDVIGTNPLSIELRFYMEIPRVIFAWFRRDVVNVMAKKEYNELIERYVSEVNGCLWFHKASIAVNGSSPS